MESFKIVVDTKEFNITPKENETYLVESDEGDLFVIVPDIADIGVVWSLTDGVASEDLVQSIGATIEEYEM